MDENLQKNCQLKLDSNLNFLGLDKYIKLWYKLLCQVAMFDLVAVVNYAEVTIAGVIQW